MGKQETTLMLASALYASMDAAWNRVCAETMTPDEHVADLVGACHQVAGHSRINSDVSLSVSSLWLVDMAKALPTAVSMLNKVKDLKSTLSGMSSAVQLTCAVAIHNHLHTIAKLHCLLVRSLQMF
jgi:hypothetical protein